MRPEEFRSFKTDNTNTQTMSVKKKKKINREVTDTWNPPTKYRKAGQTLYIIWLNINFYKQKETKRNKKKNTRRLDDEFLKATIPKIFRGYSIVIVNM